MGRELDRATFDTWVADLLARQGLAMVDDHVLRGRDDDIIALAHEPRPVLTAEQMVASEQLWRNWDRPGNELNPFTVHANRAGAMQHNTSEPVQRLRPRYNRLRCYRLTMEAGTLQAAIDDLMADFEREAAMASEHADGAGTDRDAAMRRIAEVDDDFERRRFDICEVIEHHALFDMRFEPTRAFEEYRLVVRDVRLDQTPDETLATMSARLHTLYMAAVVHAEQVGLEALRDPGLGSTATKLARTAADARASRPERASARAKLETALRTLGLPVVPAQLDALYRRELEVGHDVA